MLTRRNILTGAALLGGAVVAQSTLGAVPEPAYAPDARTVVPPAPPNGRPFHPVVTLNGWSAPWTANDGWKEFHLVAEPVNRQVAPGMRATLWGYNGQSPGPTIEAVEGDKVRIFVTNKLGEPTTVHWHGMQLPNGMDGVGGLTQPYIEPGKTYVYEFELRRSGTYMYHPHADEMVQMAMGMMGLFIVHPREEAERRVERDYAFLINAYDIAPGASLPNVSTMTDFNIWSWNSRVFPGIDPLVAAKGDRVRIRMGNLTMTNHPIHLHGYSFEVTGTDGGWVKESARWPEVTTDIPVGAMRSVEFVADQPGDWAFHCHKSHHTMGPMGHDVPTMIGLNQNVLEDRMIRLVPDFMVMGQHGMGDMGEMEMPLPANTLPMMTGTGPFGPLAMGGMFSVLKVREGLAANDYRDPGWFRHPAGTLAREAQR